MFITKNMKGHGLQLCGIKYCKGGCENNPKSKYFDNGPVKIDSQSLKLKNEKLEKELSNFEKDPNYFNPDFFKENAHPKGNYSNEEIQSLVKGEKKYIEKEDLRADLLTRLYSTKDGSLVELAIQPSDRRMAITQPWELINLDLDSIEFSDTIDAPSLVFLPEGLSSEETKLFKSLQDELMINPKRFKEKNPSFTQKEKALAVKLKKLHFNKYMTPEKLNEIQDKAISSKLSNQIMLDAHTRDTGGYKLSNLESDVADEIYSNLSEYGVTNFRTKKPEATKNIPVYADCFESSVKVFDKAGYSKDQKHDLVIGNNAYDKKGALNKTIAQVQLESPLRK